MGERRGEWHSGGGARPGVAGGENSSALEGSKGERGSAEDTLDKCL